MTNKKGKPRKLAVYLDGTWNTPGSRTNVYALYEQTIGIDGHRLRYEQFKEHKGQIKYYDNGVGTRLLNVFQGGMFGRGLDMKILNAYRFICRHYTDDTDLYIFGFSRGAYTARSLVGLLNRIGIVISESNLNTSTKAAMDLYRNWPRRPDSYYSRNEPDQYKDKLADCKIKKQNLKNKYGIFEQPAVRFIGVWDTVGALGIPVRWWVDPFKFAREKYKFHDTSLSPIVRTARHALAIDEHRFHFRTTMWDKYDKKSTDLEQRWFVGAHANIGGGYEDNYLHHRPRYWMQKEAAKSGLRFRRLLKPKTSMITEPISDSYIRFIGGIYGRVRGHKGRYYRPLKSTSANEVIDDSVEEYINHHQNYLPENLS